MNKNCDIFKSFINVFLGHPNNATHIDFCNFTYSKISHFSLFSKSAKKLYGVNIEDINAYDLKMYQDLLVYYFINKYVKPGSKILEIGGGNSRILKSLNKKYECWNLDKLEGIGNGPLSVNEVDYIYVKEYIGDFSANLPDNYFDLVFSISVLEHVDKSEVNMNNIIKDIDRIMKHSAFSLHCIDAIFNFDGICKLIKHFFKSIDTVNAFIEFDKVMADPETFYVSENIYKQNWQPLTNKSYSEFGKPLSYNILWKKQ